MDKKSRLEKTANEFMAELVKENKILKQNLELALDRIKELAWRYDELLELNLRTAIYAHQQSPENLAEINFALQAIIPPPEYRHECPNFYIENDSDFLTIYEDTARVAAQLFPEDKYFQPLDE